MPPLGVPITLLDAGRRELLLVKRRYTIFGGARAGGSTSPRISRHDLSSRR
jgi:hypothetical protein